jgi:catechol 2,3-dioxygenase-like lactoylglutathione lyase family enzyme
MNIPQASDSYDNIPDVQAQIVGLHHVRIPVTDAWVSRNWYMTVLGFNPVLDLQQEQGLIGVVLRHPGGIVLGLHQDPTRAAILQGFAVLGLSVLDRARLQEWADELNRLGLPHRSLEEGHMGWYLDIPDPDGILVRLHTGTATDAEEA